MSKEIKLQAGQWYRTRGRKIVYVFGKRISEKSVFLFMGEFKDGKTIGFTKDGQHLKNGGNSIYDIVEHLPGCDGFNWEPPKPQPKYRPFLSKLEAKPFQNEWLVDEDGDETRIISLRETGIQTWRGYYSWTNACQKLRKLDGSPFGVEVTE